MALKKQSIRKNMHIIVDGEELAKDDLIALSEEWTEVQENFFRKMLKQGGHFKLKDHKFIVELAEADNKRSDGNKDSGVVQIPGEDSRF
ncbi:hypothetical protein N9Z41_00615 [bacterium]|nr:hypothetical protein [bacterium]